MTRYISVPTNQLYKYINLYNSGDISMVTGTAAVTRGKISLDANFVDFNNMRLTEVATPTVSSDAANKGYVDSVAGGAIEVGTLATMLAKTGMTEGNQFFPYKY